MHLTTGLRCFSLLAAASFALPAAARAQLLHHYQFTSAATDAIGGAHGTLVGGATVSGGTLTLNGIDGYVQFTTNLVPTSGSYTVAFRARRNAAQSGSYTEFISQGVSGGPGFYIGTDPAGNLRITDQVVNTGLAAPPVGVMTHYALTVDALNNSSAFYLGGALVGAINFAISTPSGGTQTRFGRQFDPFGEFLDGEMDDVRIYGNALSQGEVALIASVNNVPEPSTLGMMVAGLLVVAGAQRRRLKRRA